MRNGSDITRFAANHVLTDGGLLGETMVEVTYGVVTQITELASLNHEPPATQFLNGTLTAEDDAPLFVGYRGKIVHHTIK